MGGTQTHGQVSLTREHLKQMVKRSEYWCPWYEDWYQHLNNIQAKYINLSMEDEITGTNIERGISKMSEFLNFPLDLSRVQPEDRATPPVASTILNWNEVKQFAE